MKSVLSRLRAPRVLSVAGLGVAAAFAGVALAASPAVAESSGSMTIAVAVPGFEPRVGLTWQAAYRCDDGAAGRTSFGAETVGTVKGLTAGTACDVTVTAAESDDYVTVPARSARLSATSVTPVTVTATRRVTSIVVVLDTIGEVGVTTADLTCTGPGDERYDAQGIALTGQGLGSRVRVDGVPTGMLCSIAAKSAQGGVTAVPPAVKVLAGDTAALKLEGLGQLEVDLNRTGGSTEQAISVNYSCDQGTNGTTALRGGERLAMSLSAGATCTFRTDDDRYVAANETKVVVPLGETKAVTIPITRATARLSITTNLSGGEPDLFAAVRCSGPDGEVFEVTDLPLPGSGAQAHAVTQVPTGLACTVTPAAGGPGFVFQPASRTVPSGSEVVFSAAGTGSLSLSVTVDGPADQTRFPVAYSCTDGRHGTVDLTVGRNSVVNDIVGGAQCEVTGSATHFTSASRGKISVPAGLVTQVPISFTRRLVPLEIEVRAVGGTPQLAADVSCADPAASAQTPSPATSFVRSGVPLSVAASGVGTVQVPGVPDGYQCSVATRSLSQGFVVADQKVAISAGEKATVNVAGRGTLSVGLARYGGSDTTVLPVSYTCSDGTRGTLQISSTAPGTVPGVLGGSTCTVRASSDHFDLTLPGSPTLITAGLTSATTITAVRQTTTLTLTTKVVGGGGTFLFSVNCTGGGETFAIATVSLVAGEFSGPDTRVIAGVPTDLTCVVKPAKLPAGFATDVAERSAPAGGKVAFTTVGTGAASLVTTVSGATPNSTFSVKYSCTDGTEQTYAVGVAGDTRQIKGLRGGSNCSISTDTPGFRAEIKESPWLVVPGETNQVKIALVRERADLVIEATTDGPEGTFNYDIACADADEQVTTTAVLVTLEGEGITIVPRVPTGLNCSIKEKAQPQWAVAQPEQTTLPGRTVTFVHRKKKPVTVSAFYDANLNGIHDQGEIPLSGWQVAFDGAKSATGANGTITVNVVSGASWTAGRANNWRRTTSDPSGEGLPTTWDLALVCLGDAGSSSAGLHAPGWWADRGPDTITSTDLAALRTLPLVDSEGRPFEPNDVEQLGTWLTASPGQSTAARVSQELAAGVLNLRHSPQLGATMVTAPEVGFIAMDKLVAAANVSLQADGYTPPADPNRIAQDRLHKALASANSGLSSVSATPCAVPTEFTF